MPDLKWSGLHDAVLVAARLDWGSGSAILELRVWGFEQPRIRARGLRRLEVPREHAWGPSASILDAKHEHDAERERLDLQMQSGDLIRIEADEIRLVEGT